MVRLRSILLGSLAGAGFWGMWSVFSADSDISSVSQLVTIDTASQPKAIRATEPLSVSSKGFRSEVAESARATALLLPSDQRQFDQILKFSQRESLAAAPMGQVIQAIAERFLGSAYQAGLLEQSPTEQMFVSLQQFDCVLFIETVVALARTVVQPEHSIPTFVQHIEAQRYRGGHLQNYCSRLHYFSDWIADGERRGLVKDLTAALGGVPLNKTLNFMSRHRDSYRQLRSSDTARCIVKTEAALTQLHPSYIATANIRSIYPQLQAGDIIAIATAVPGLDVTHTGFVEQRNGGTGIVHASPGSVRRSPDLQTYASRVEDAIGIMVVRVMPPTKP